MGGEYGAPRIMNLRKIIFSIFALCIFILPHNVSADTLFYSLSDTPADGTFKFFGYDVGGDFWSHQDTCNSSLLRCIGASDFLYSFYSRSNKQLVVLQVDTTANFSTYIAGTLDDAKSNPLTATWYYVETDSLGSLECYGIETMSCTVSRPVSESSTVFIPIDTQLNNLTCVSNSPTSTCTFEYSTTTATSTTIDYSRHFDLFLLLTSILMFACGIALFRGLAKKYL